MELLYYICILSYIEGLNGKEEKEIAKVPRKVLVIETDLEDQRSFYERNKGSDFIIYRFYIIHGLIVYNKTGQCKNHTPRQNKERSLVWFGWSSNTSCGLTIIRIYIRRRCSWIYRSFNSKCILWWSSRRSFRYSPGTFFYIPYIIYTIYGILSSNYRLRIDSSFYENILSPLGRRVLQ